MHRRAFRINDGTMEERSIASVTFLWVRNPDFIGDKLLKTFSEFGISSGIGINKN
jgi:hypothetical protein